MLSEFLLVWFSVSIVPYIAYSPWFSDLNIYILLSLIINCQNDINNIKINLKLFNEKV